MKKYIISIFLLSASLIALADNPLVRTMYTADPTARIVGDKLFIFPSSDVPAVENGKNNNGFFMPYYHIFSSENLMEWQDHGRQIDQNDVPWGEKDSYAMWAPDCIEKDGKFYYYFPAQPKGDVVTHNIGVAVAKKPEGPYKYEKRPIKGIVGIDPNVFIDDDGSAYIYWSAQNELFGCKLKDNMKELDGEPIQISGIPSPYKEAPFVFKRNGIYYITFSQTTPYKFCELSYGVSDSPLGKVDYKGAFMKNWPDLWTNHHSFAKYNGEWILFYHHCDISHHSRLRSICADYISFANDGSINMLHPTLRGIGICDASSQIEIDRYSEIAPKGTTIERNGNELPASWRVVATSESLPAWVRYNRVDFSKKEYKEVKVCYRTPRPTDNMKLVVRRNGFYGDVVATVNLSSSDDWNEVVAPLNFTPSGQIDLVCSFEGADGFTINVDWITFN